MVNECRVKLLILTGYLHCPPISGGAMRMVNPILKLAMTGRYDVTYLFQYRSDEEVQRVKSFFAPYPQVSLVSIRNRNQFNVSERDLQLEIPLEVFNAMDLAYYQELERLLETEQFDLVQVEHSWMSWVVPLIRKNRPDLPVILDLHNIEAILFQRWIQYGSDNEREEMAVRWERTRRWEEETWQWFDACLPVSPLELQAYQAQTGYQIPAWELPSGGGIDLSRFPRTDSARRRKKETILSLGTLEWSANTHGLLWFINEVMPLLKQTHPYACLCIAGFGTPDNKLMQHILGRKDINFLGELKDERPMLSRSKVFIVPLWIGAGARVKILTAWAAGIPVVATTIGAEGLNYTEGENILIADKPGEFAGKIIRLMDDEALALRLSHNGRALVEEHYSLEYAVRVYDQAYNSIMEGTSLSTTSQHVDYDFGKKERMMRQLMQLKADMPVMLDVGKYESALSAIHQSLVWRMLARYDRVINKLLPQGTNRRGIYNLYVSAFRIIVNEGWRSFGYKFRQWLEQRRRARRVTGEYPPEILSISDPSENIVAYVLRTSDEIKESKQVKMDLTGRFDYKRLCEQEVQHYSIIEVTEALTEGGVHAQKAWGFWFRYLSDNAWKTSFNKEVIDFCNSIDSPKILSLGCGYGGIELSVAKRLKKPYDIIATDINRNIFVKAIQEASKNDINIRFISLDLNFVEIRKNSFDAIIASASLHHLLNLEHIFHQVYKGLKEDGRFIIQDVIGQRQVLFWKENVEFALNVIRQLPSRYKKGISEESLPHYNEPDLQIGMEGIRQEEIEFELNKYFTPIKLFKYGSFMRLICTNPIIGKLLDPDNIEDKKVLESLCNLDIQKVEQKELRPTEMFGVFRKKSRPTRL